MGSRAMERKSFADLSVGDRFLVREMLPNNGDGERFRYMEFKKAEPSYDPDGLAFNATTIKPMNGQFPDDAQVLFCESDKPATEDESSALLQCTLDLVYAAIERNWNDVMDISEDLGSLVERYKERLSWERKNQ